MVRDRRSASTRPLPPLRYFPRAQPHPVHAGGGCGGSVTLRRSAASTGGTDLRCRPLPVQRNGLLHPVSHCVDLVSCGDARTRGPWAKVRTALFLARNLPLVGRSTGKSADAQGGRATGAAWPAFSSRRPRPLLTHLRPILTDWEGHYLTEARPAVVNRPTHGPGSRSRPKERRHSFWPYGELARPGLLRRRGGAPRAGRPLPSFVVATGLLAISASSQRRARAPTTLAAVAGAGSSPAGGLAVVPSGPPLYLGEPSSRKWWPRACPSPGRSGSAARSSRAWSRRRSAAARRPGSGRSTSSSPPSSRRPRPPATRFARRSRTTRS